MFGPVESGPNAHILRAANKSQSYFVWKNSPSLFLKKNNEIEINHDKIVISVFNVVYINNIFFYYVNISSNKNIDIKFQKRSLERVLQVCLFANSQTECKI